MEPLAPELRGPRATRSSRFWKNSLRFRRHQPPRGAGHVQGPLHAGQAPELLAGARIPHLEEGRGHQPVPREGQPQGLGLPASDLLARTEVEHASSAIGGDPMEVTVLGTSISIRKQQAGSFKVSPLNPNA